MAVTKEEVLDYIDNMTVLELSELVKELEDKFGVTAAAPMMAMPAAMGGAALRMRRPPRRRSSTSFSSPPVKRKSRSSRKFDRSRAWA